MGGPQAPSHNSMREMVLIRHASTEYHFLKRMMYIVSADKHFARHFVLYSTSPQLIDSPITLSATQSEIPMAKAHFKSLLNPVRIVFSSPCFRSLQTTTELFREEIRSKTVRVVVHPDLRPRMNTNYSYPIQWCSKMDEFPDFDWSLMKSIDGSNLAWMMSPLEKRHWAQELRAELQQGKTIEEQLALIQRFKKNWKASTESSEALFKRIKSFCAELRKVMDEEQAGRGEVALVGHNFILETLELQRLVCPSRIMTDVKPFDNVECRKVKLYDFF